MDTMAIVRLIITLVGFVVITLVLFISNFSKLSRIKKGKKKKNKDIKYIEVQYLHYKYNIVKERLYTKGFAFFFAFINALIICTTFYLIELIPWHFAFQLLIGFVLLMAFIYSIYGIIGTILVKRGYQNEL